MSVMPASSAAWIVATAWSSSGYWLSLFIEMGIAPRPMAETVNGPSWRVCIPLRLAALRYAWVCYRISRTWIGRSS